MSKLSTFVYGHVRPMVILLAGFVSLLEVGSLIRLVLHKGT